MRNYYRVLLALLCALFGIAYFSLGEFKDLTANLFTALLAVLVFDWLIERAKLQRSQPSVEHVKTRVLDIYDRLIWKCRPPKDWKERLESREQDWTDFFEKIWDVKNYASKDLEDILDKYYDLIDSDMKNDILEMVALLRNPVFLLASDPEYEKRSLFDLVSVAGDIARVVSESVDTIRRHNLLDYPSRHTLTVTRPGEVPQTTKRELTDEEKHQRKERRFELFYDQFLKESIDFREACHKSVFPAPK